MRYSPVSPPQISDVAIARGIDISNTANSKVIFVRQLVVPKRCLLWASPRCLALVPLQEWRYATP